MMDNTDLIAEARAAAGDPPSLLGRLADALEAAAPPPPAEYRTVRLADDNPQVGELVRSKWGSARTAAIWRIDRVEEVASSRHVRRHLRLHLVSLRSNRRDERIAWNMEIVVPTE